MNQRERFLVIVIVGLVGAYGVHLAFGKYRNALLTKNNKLISLAEESKRLNVQVRNGALADRQMGEYLVRSLPSDLETASSTYQSWLVGLVQKHELQNADVKPNSVKAKTVSVRKGSRMTPVPFYAAHKFTVSGDTTMPQFVDFLHAFYQKDYLHRISTLEVKQDSKSNRIRVTASIDVVGLAAAKPDAVAPESRSWRVEPTVASYRPILNRNLFEPPNSAPEYEGSDRISTIVGSRSQDLKFKDAENHNIRYELVSKVEGVDIDESGKLNMTLQEMGNVEIVVRAIDDGYPSRSTETPLTIRVGDTPPPAAELPEFDHSRQTVLTGLVSSGDEMVAWLNIRTLGKTLKLRTGDKFEIGSLSGIVIEVNSRLAVLEIDGQQFSLRQRGNLAKAASRAE